MIGFHIRLFGSLVNINLKTDTSRFAEQTITLHKNSVVKKKKKLKTQKYFNYLLKYFTPLTWCFVRYFLDGYSRKINIKNWRFCE